MRSGGRRSDSCGRATFVKVAGKRGVGGISRRNASRRHREPENAGAPRLTGRGGGAVAQREREPGPRRADSDAARRAVVGRGKGAVGGRSGRHPGVLRDPSRAKFALRFQSDGAKALGR